MAVLVKGMTYNANAAMEIAKYDELYALRYDLVRSSKQVRQQQ